MAFNFNRCIDLAFDKEGTLRSWLQDIDPARDRDQLAVMIFTRAPLDLRSLSSK